MKRRTVVGTANFAHNLESLRAFHTESPGGFERAVGKLQDEVLPLLRQQANVGRLFDRGRPLIERVSARLGGGVLREVLVDEYLMLYLVGEKRIALLSIRHQRELDFDFGE